MAPDGGFLVEEFINAIAAQLDRVQDALRLKAVNRPLTYALRDFALDLQVFVGMDGEGNVRFRSSAPNETGASTIRLGFTTITRPMIEENTVSLAMTRGPSLAELGLEPQERQRLEHLGVTNAAQLKQLGATTGARTVARLTEIPEDRIRRALQLGRPSLGAIRPEPAQPPAAPAPAAAPVAPAQPDPAAPGVQPSAPAASPHARPVFSGGPAKTFDPASGVGVGLPGAPVGGFDPGRVSPVQNGSRVAPVRTAPAAGNPFAGGIARGPAGSGLRGIGTRPTISSLDYEPNGHKPAVPAVSVPHGTDHLRLSGRNLLSPDGLPAVALNGQLLAIADGDDDHLLVALPPEAESGALTVELPDGETLAYHLSIEPPLAHTDSAWPATASAANGHDRPVLATTARGGYGRPGPATVPDGYGSRAAGPSTTPPDPWAPAWHGG